MIRELFLASSEKTVIEEVWEAIVEQYLTPKFGHYQNINISTDPLISPAAIFIGLFFAVMIVCAVSIFTKRTLGRPVRLLLKHDAVGRRNAKTLAQVGLEKVGVVRFFINRLTLSKAIRCVEEDEFYGIEDADEALGDEAVASDAAPKACAADLSADEARLAEISEPADAVEDRAESADAVEDTAEQTDKKGSKKNKKGKNTDEQELFAAEEIKARSGNAFYVAGTKKEKYRRRAESDRFYIDERLKHRMAIRFSSSGTNPVICLFVAVAYIAFGLLVVRFLPDILQFIDDAISSFK